MAEYQLAPPRATYHSRQQRPSSGPAHPSRSHRLGHATAHLTASHWTQSLAKSPQLRADLASAGVNVRGLSEYVEASKSRPVTLNKLNDFLDPKARGAAMAAIRNAAEWSEDVNSGRLRRQNAQGWNSASHSMDWPRELNGSRELTLLCTETALLHPETEAGQLALQRLAAAEGAHADLDRKTDRRTGHSLEYTLPSKERFVKDAYYARIIDERRAEEGRAPDQRLPRGVLYSGEIHELAPSNDNERRAVERHRRAATARHDNIGARSAHHWGPKATDPNPHEYVTTQAKKASIHGCAAAAENTYNRLFHLDAPKPLPGQHFAPRHPAALAREQNIRDRSCHGRDYEVLGNTVITVIPVSKEAQLRNKLSEPRQCGRQFGFGELCCVESAALTRSLCICVIFLLQMLPPVSGRMRRTPPCSSSNPAYTGTSFSTPSQILTLEFVPAVDSTIWLPSNAVPISSKVAFAHALGLRELFLRELSRATGTGGAKRRGTLCDCCRACR
jgi:hypothetical protein